MTCTSCYMISGGYPTMHEWCWVWPLSSGDDHHCKEALSPLESICEVFFKAMRPFHSPTSFPLMVLPSTDDLCLNQLFYYYKCWYSNFMFSSTFYFLVSFCNLEMEMATHSSILAWRTPWTEEPSGLQSMGSQESDTTEWLSRVDPSVKNNFSLIIEEPQFLITSKANA